MLWVTLLMSSLASVQAVTYEECRTKCAADKKCHHAEYSDQQCVIHIINGKYFTCKKHCYGDLIPWVLKGGLEKTNLPGG